MFGKECFCVTARFYFNNMDEVKNIRQTLLKNHIASVSSIIRSDYQNMKKADRIDYLYNLLDNYKPVFAITFYNLACQRGYDYSLKSFYRDMSILVLDGRIDIVKHGVKTLYLKVKQ